MNCFCHRKQSYNKGCTTFSIRPYTRNDHNSSLSTFDRNLVVIKLADILEEYIDAGLAYTPKRILHATNPNLDESLDVVIGLAKSLCSKEWSERYLSYVMSCREYQPAEVLLRDDKRLWHVNRKRLKELGYQVPWFERLRGWF